jgi:hypothetical protein
VKTLLVIALITVSMTQTALAKAKSKSAATTSKTSATKTALGTDHSFSAADVRGRYQYPAGGTVTVENEKELVDLLGVRKHFKDRLTTETTRK